ARPRSVTAVPLGIRRSSGSRVRLPIRKTLFNWAIASTSLERKGTADPRPARASVDACSLEEATTSPPRRQASISEHQRPDGIGYRPTRRPAMTRTGEFLNHLGDDGEGGRPSPLREGLPRLRRASRSWRGRSGARPAWV